jgi:hypothetical protein
MEDAKQDSPVGYQTIEDFLLQLPVPTVRKFLSYGKYSGDLLALYSFYILTSRRQKTNQIWCTKGFICKGLNWSETKVVRARRILRDELKLIEEIPAIGRDTKSYIRIKYLIRKGTIAYVDNGQLVLDGEFTEGNETTKEKKEKLSEEDRDLLADMFDCFYDKYPPCRRINRTKNREKFESILTKKGKIDFQLFEQMDEGLDKYLRTRKWQEVIAGGGEPQFIPHMSTWLNQKRWEEADALPEEKEVKPIVPLEDPDPELTESIIRMFKNLIDTPEYELSVCRENKFIMTTQRMLKFFERSKSPTTGNYRIPRTAWVDYLKNCMIEEHKNKGDTLHPGHLCANNTWDTLMPQYLQDLGQWYEF